jgi:hypothetical protein
MRRARNGYFGQVAIACASVIALVGCPDVNEPKVPAGGTNSSVPHCELLVVPESDGASLLGRAVERAADGSMRIADARAPGCDVRVERELSTFHTSSVVSVHSMTSIGGGYAMIAALAAKFGSNSNFNFEVENTAKLKGNLSAACSGTVIDAVYVGRGRRQLATDSHGSVDGHVALPGSAVGGSWDKAHSRDDQVEWAVEEAYGFTTKESARSEGLQIQAQMASTTLTEGDELQVQFDSPQQPAWLIVYYVDSNNHGDVLWPSNEEPEPYVAPGKPAMLPSPRERARGIHFKASVPKPGEPSHESIVAYGFVNKADFDVLKPSAGAENADGPTYAASLKKGLQGVPMNRWSRTVVEYVIKPKQ